LTGAYLDAQAINNLEGLFEDERKAEHEQKIMELYADIGKLSTQLTWLKSPVSNLLRGERLAMLDCKASGLPLSTKLSC